MTIGRMWCELSVACPGHRGNTFFFFAVRSLDFESAVTDLNDEFKGSFLGSFSRLLNVKTSPRSSILSLDTSKYVR